MADSGVEGALQIGLQWSGRKVERVAIGSSRPLQLPRIFNGKRANEVCGMLPLLYSVCGLAQGCAAVQAFEQALSIDPSPRTAQLRRLLIAFETVKEHLWRIEIDWVRALGLELDRVPLSRTLTLLVRFRAALFGDQDPFLPGASDQLENRGEALDIVTELESLLAQALFTSSPAAWLQRMAAGGFSAWLDRSQRPAQLLLSRLLEREEAGLGAAPVSAMGELDRKLLNIRLSAQDSGSFVAQPDWQGDIPETTAYGRQRDLPPVAQLSAEHGAGLLSRLFARVVEIAVLCNELRTGVGEPEMVSAEDAATVRADVGAGIGLAQVEAARGRLIHRVEMAGERVGRYQILAPTEWNFHPRGVLVRGLVGLPAESEAELRRRAELLINAIDPCVGYRILVNEAGIDAPED